MSKPPFLQHFIVQGKYLGSALRGKVWVQAERQSPRSMTFVCGVCGDAWAKCPVEKVGSPTELTQFIAMLRVCPKHSQSSYDVPGSLTLSWDGDFNDSFPEAVVQWEFQQHLALFPDTDES